MTEKTFRDMLPLTDEQREILSEPYGARQNCDGCPCDIGPDCAKLLGVYPATCKVVRNMALRLDDEYKMEYLRTVANVYDSDTMSLSLLAERNMKKEILSQDEVWKIRNTFGCPSEIIQSHAAALERVAGLETLKDNLAVQIDRRDMDWNAERKQFNERIADLEKQLCEAKELAEYNSDFQIKTQDIIHELESRLATYEPVQMDTWVEASDKCKAKADALAKNGNPAIFEVEQNCFVLTTSDDRFEFPYAEPREPQPGDLMLNGFGNAFTFSHYCCDDDGCSFDVEGGSHDNIKPTGFRVNENGNIVPIARRSE